MKRGDPVKASRGRGCRARRGSRSRAAATSSEELGHHRLLGAEVVVDEPVGDARLVGDVGDARGVVALPREDADSRLEYRAALSTAEPSPQPPTLTSCGHS